MFLVEIEQNIENLKKLSFSQRITIENLLNQRKRKFEIANELDKSPSTITREINVFRDTFQKQVIKISKSGKLLIVNIE